MMKRRAFLRTAGAASAAWLAYSRSALASAAATEVNRRATPSVDRPNVLIVMTDQHRADLMTCAGHDLVPTPGIDRIAARGVRFNRAYCPYPVCVASRMALLTGLYAHTTGVDTNTDRLDWRYRTMAHHFADHGYLTGLIGKMHFNDAHKHGFEYYLSINDWLMYLGPKARHYADEIASHPHTNHFTRTVDDSGAGLPDIEGLWDGPSPWVGNVTRRDFKTMASKLEADDHLDMFIARETVKFMRQYRNQRFFLVASFMKPHTPFFPPREFAEKYPIDKMTLRPVGPTSTYPKHIQQRIANYRARDPHRLRAGRAGYLGNLAFVDTCIDRVYRGLEELGLLDNTIVVYTSDHGEMDGDHGLYQKFCLFEPAVQVPLIVSYPRHLPQNKVSNALTEYFGLYPTLAELAGLPQPKQTTLVDMPGAPSELDAHSFASVVRNPDAPGPPAAFAEFALRSKMPRYMIRTDRYKLIYNHGAMHELYDYDNDPGEYTNRIGDPEYRSVQRELQDQLVTWYDPESNPYRAKS
jgi:choline-sulfatase